MPKIDTSEFENMTPFEKLEILIGLMEVQKILTDKAENLRANPPKWWQFNRKRKYREAWIAWNRAAEEYNDLLYAYRCATVFEDPIDAINIIKQQQSDLHDDVHTNNEGECSDPPLS